VRHVLDENLNTVYTTDYSAYGETFNNTGANPMDYGYTGQPLDANGLAYHRARYYDASMGVWLSEDPLELVNRYGYVDGNPISLVDIIGLSSCNSPCNSQQVNSSAPFVLETSQFGIVGNTTNIFSNADSSTIQNGHLIVKSGAEIPELSNSIMTPSIPINIHVPARQDFYNPSTFVANQDPQWERIWVSNRSKINYGYFGEYSFPFSRYDRMISPMFNIWGWLPAEPDTDGMTFNLWGRTEQVARALRTINNTSLFGEIPAPIFGVVPDANQPLPEIVNGIPNNQRMRERSANATNPSNPGGTGGLDSRMALFSIFVDLLALERYGNQMDVAWDGQWGDYDGIIFAEVQKRQTNECPNYRAVIYNLSFATWTNGLQAEQYMSLSYIVANEFRETSFHHPSAVFSLGINGSSQTMFDGDFRVHIP